MKQCSKCKKFLKIEFFYKKIGNKDGVQNWCKSCDNKRHKLWRKNHPEKVRQMSKLQRIRHPEKMRAAVNKYGRTHPEVSRKAVLKWAKKNKNKISVYKKVYYAIKTGKLKLRQLPTSKRYVITDEEIKKIVEAFGPNGDGLWFHA
jgi:hypothetical protein